MTGIEPALPAWEAGVLPLNYIRIRDQSPWGGVKQGKPLNSGPTTQEADELPDLGYPFQSALTSSVPYSGPP